MSDVRLENVSKSFKDMIAVDNLSLTLVLLLGVICVVATLLRERRQVS